MNKKHVTAQDLASHFEVSRRTILRDIDTLATAGIPVYTTQGKGGGIFIQHNFVLNKAFISENEQKQILYRTRQKRRTQTTKKRRSGNSFDHGPGMIFLLLFLLKVIRKERLFTAMRQR